MLFFVKLGFSQPAQKWEIILGHFPMLGYFVLEPFAMIGKL